VFDFTAYVLLADQQFIVFLHRWFPVSQWYFIYPLAMFHTSAWVILKITLIRGATVLVQKRQARRKAKHPEVATASTGVRRILVKFAHWIYAEAKHTAHGKPMSGYSLFWLALTPLFQKLGDAIVGIRWQQFGWRGVGSLCLGASMQAGCYCLLYSIYGKRQAEQYMLWIMLPLGVIMLLGWVLKNGRKQLE
jgi:hypothetical protein